MNDAQKAQHAAQTLRSSMGVLSTRATARMADDLPWFSDLSAEHRSWVGLIVQAGLRDFVEWFEAEENVHAPSRTPLAAAVFGAAPRELTGVITLQQTVELIRRSILVVEESITDLVRGDELGLVHEAVLRYAREVAFATAEVYARAAEVRGAWDARLEALVVDAVLRAEADDSVVSRAAALGWAGDGGVTVVVGNLPLGQQAGDVFEALRHDAQEAGLSALCAAHGDLLAVLVGGSDDPLGATTSFLSHFGAGPVIVGPTTPDLATAHTSAREALSARSAAAGWPGAPRPVSSDDLLPERALAGDAHARVRLVDDVFTRLMARPTLVETLEAWFDHGASVEATARALFVHANTVRYRLRQVSEETGLSPTLPRENFTLQISLALGRLGLSL